VRNSSRIVDVADDARAAFEDIYARGWTDGLPVIPPKAEYVQEMLDTNGLNRDEVVATLAPDGAAATVEKIAINAVMAGCRNDYLPVLIAAVKAIAQPQFNLLWVQATTNPVAPLVVINGPLRSRLDLNCGRGALGPGRRANATIGRALRLIMVNIGGGSPGDIDKAVLGQPAKYSFCMGEMEEDHPWEPLHVELGYQREQSVVSVIGVQGLTSIRTPFSKPESILAMIANAMTVYGNNSYNNSSGNPVLVFTPGYANLFHHAGWPKLRIKEWLYEHTKVPRSLLPTESSQTQHRRPKIDAGDDRLCICTEPDDIKIIVAGSSEPYHMTYLPSAGSTDLAAQPIVIP